MVTRDRFPRADAKHILLSAGGDSHPGLSLFLSSFLPFFLSALSAIVQFLSLPTDDWFKRPGALQRLCMTSEETLSPETQRSVCVHACVRATQIGRQAVLTRVWIVCAQRCDTR